MSMKHKPKESWYRKSQHHESPANHQDIEYNLEHMTNNGPESVFACQASRCLLFSCWERKRDESKKGDLPNR
jgi:hypothetical protein